MVKCKYEGTGIWDGRCTGTKEVDPCPGYDKCKQYKPKYTTNADRIREMNDMGIAKMFTQAASNGCPPDMDGDCKKDDEGWEACDKCWCKWLKQLAE